MTDGITSERTGTDTNAPNNLKTLIDGLPEAAVSEPSIAAGAKIGKYEVRAQLGSGGMGAVYLAFDPLIEREVAIKVLSPGLGNSPTVLQRFLGEARSIGRLNHPNIVAIYDIDQWNGQYYLVMELLAGGSVADQVEENRPLPWREACRIVTEAALGLSAAHSAGIIHRDLKPENLMLSKDGKVKVVDFGLSKLIDASQDTHQAVTSAGQILGTPQYMSPEQFEASEVDARTDIYSLGATLHRLLTARFPYHDCRTIVQVMSAHLTKPAPVPSEYNPGIPSRCDEIIARSMAKDPKDRYQSTVELASALTALLDSVPQAADVLQPAVSDRPLQMAVIVEPSKLQAAILKDALSQAGVRSVRVLAGFEMAVQTIEKETPDLLMSAMQLSDGRGIELVQKLCQKSLLRQSAVVLNSSDITIDELIDAGLAGCLILAPKKVKPDDILRIVHAAGPSEAPDGSLTSPIDPTTANLRIVLKSGRIAPTLAEMIRDLKLLDVDVVSNTAAVQSNLALIMVNEHSCDSHAAAGLLVQNPPRPGQMFAVVQVQSRGLYLRALSRNGVVGVCDRLLDSRRLTGLLQGCRN